MTRPPLSLAIALLVVACAQPRDGAPSAPIAAPKPGPSSSGKTANKPAPARVHVMKKGEELGGPNATGKAGDWILENGEVVFVVDGLGGGGGFAESGGNIVDAADARVRKDELGQLFTYFGTFPRQALYESIEPSTQADGSALITARGREIHEPSIEVVTHYRLAPGDRAVRLATTLKNGGAKPVKLGLGDAIQWGGCEKFAPGKAVGFKGPSSGPFLGGIGRFTSYGITSTDGAIDAINGSVWSDTEQKRDVTIAPGQSVSYERIFLVGERGDAASVIAEVAKASPDAQIGRLEVGLVDGAGRAIVAPLGAKVVISTPSGQDVMSLVASAEGPSFGGEIPAGRWLVAFGPSAGRRGNGTKVAVEVKQDATARVKLVVSDAARLSVGCDDGLPCRAIVEGRDGTPTPDFGPPHVAVAARNQVFAAGRAIVVPVPPGSYRLTFVRGPEYAAEVVDVEAIAGAERAARATLRRVVDTRGYLAGDFHQHSILSADAPVAIEDRVRSNAVEGVEIAVASEHNNVVDMSAAVASLDLKRFVVSIAGDEITTDADKDAWGHANVFPLVPRPDKPRAGAFAFLGRTPKDVFDEARRLPDDPIIQINHPRSGLNGYFDRTGFDPKTGVGTRAGYDAAFDSIEVWNGRNVEHRAKVLDDFMALLRTGHPVTPMGDTDTHGIVGQEAGYPRTYVRVDKDDALEEWNKARTADLQRGIRVRRDVVLTNGPFMTVSANGAPIGGIAKPKAGVVEVKVHVQSAPFATVEKVSVRFAAGGSAPSETAPNASGDVTFKLRVAKDDAFIVVASGGKPMRPLLSGDDKEIEPWAMTGAIWVDADGDGKSLGR